MLKYSHYNKWRLKIKLLRVKYLEKFGVNRFRMNNLQKIRNFIANPTKIRCSRSVAREQWHTRELTLSQRDEISTGITQIH